MSRRRLRRRTAAATGGRLASVVLVVMLAAVAPAAGADEQTSPRRTTASLSRYEQDVLRAVNDIRAKWGRARLSVSPALTEAAEFHTARMIRLGFFEHEAPGEAPFWHRVEQFYRSARYEYWAVGENLAYGSPSIDPGEAVHEWMLSPRHRRSLLSKPWREVGVAAVHVESAPGEFAGDPATVITLDLGVRRR